MVDLIIHFKIKIIINLGHFSLINYFNLLEYDLTVSFPRLPLIFIIFWLRCVQLFMVQRIFELVPSHR
jgi:hypothetical protein